jgi:hypothetical protein
MSADNRTVHTDALATLGTVIDDKQARDAIHLAVLPAIAGETLFPGTHVRLVDGEAFAGGETYGIVDPFLKDYLNPGDRFWLVIYPRQITSLRHVWEHPMFPEKPAPRELTAAEQEVVDLTRGKMLKPASLEWLRNFCAESSGGPPFDDLIEKLESGDLGSEWDDKAMHFSGVDAHGDIPAEFWNHVENVIGRKLGDDERPEYFSCAC